MLARKAGWDGVMSEENGEQMDLVEGVYQLVKGFAERIYGNMEHGQVARILFYIAVLFPSVQPICPLSLRKRQSPTQPTL